MEKYYHEFVGSLKKFVENLNRYVPNEGCADFIKYFDQLQMGKVMLRYLNKMRKYEVQLKNKDETMFANNFEILPNIDLHIYWPKLKSGQKNKLWTILQILYIQSEILLNNSEIKDSSSEKNKVLNEMIDNIGDDVENNGFSSSDKKNIQLNESSNCITTRSIDNKYMLTINPYIGILSESQQIPESGYSMNEMFSGPEILPGDSPNSSGILGNLNGLLDVEKLSEELKNMTPEQIDEATNNIKSLLGDTDQKTTDVIHTMLTGIQNELKSESIDTSDPWGCIGKISEKVAKNLQSKLDDDGVVMANLISSTQKLGNCKDANGNPIFGGTMNPFTMLQGLIGKMSGGVENQKFSGSVPQMPQMPQINKNCNKNSVNSPNPTPQQMLKEMGLEDFDLNNINPGNMAAMQQKIFKNIQKMDQNSNKNTNRKNLR